MKSIAKGRSLTKFISFWDSKQVYEIINLNSAGVCLLGVSSKLGECECGSWICDNPIVSILEVTNELEIPNDDCDHALKKTTERKRKEIIINISHLTVGNHLFFLVEGNFINLFYLLNNTTSECLTSWQTVIQSLIHDSACIIEHDCLECWQISSWVVVIVCVSGVFLKSHKQKVHFLINFVSVIRQKRRILLHES